MQSCVLCTDSTDGVGDMGLMGVIDPAKEASISGQIIS